MNGLQWCVATGVVLVLAGCAGRLESQVEEGDTSELYMEFAWAYMALDHTREMAKLRMSHPEFPKPPRSGAELARRNDPRRLARVLRETVWEYNAESSGLCANNLYTEWSCLPPLNPSWLNEPMGASPSLEELRRRSALVDARLEPLWRGACADYQARNTEAVVAETYMQYCSIE